MDKDICGWIVEFLLRQSCPETFINDIMKALPLPETNVRLMKSLILRSIQAESAQGSLSEKILDYLQTIIQMEVNQGVTIKDSMRQAFCAVAVGCTVDYLEGPFDKFSDAVNRIWNTKIGSLSNDLLRGALTTWREEFETALHNPMARKALLRMNTRNEALRLLRAYLTDAWALMGPSFLERAASTIVNESAEGSSAQDGVCNQNDQGDRAQDGEQAASGLVVNQTAGKRSRQEHQGNSSREGEIQRIKRQRRFNRIAMSRSYRGPVRIVEPEEEDELDAEPSSSKCSAPPTTEVNKVQGRLESSPLQPAMNNEAIFEEQRVKDKDMPTPSVTPSNETDQGKEGRNQSGIKQNDMPNSSSMERCGTGTACTEVNQANQSCTKQNDIPDSSSMEMGGTGTACTEGEQANHSCTKQNDMPDSSSMERGGTGTACTEGNQANQSCTKKNDVPNSNSMERGGTGTPCTEGNQANQSCTKQNDVPNSSSIERSGTGTACTEDNQGNQSGIKQNDVPNSSSVERGGTGTAYTEDNQGNQSGIKQNYMPNSSSVERGGTGTACAEGNQGNQSCIGQNDGPKSSSVEKSGTGTACSYEHEMEISRRRRVRRWSPHEENALREAVNKYGKGNWKLILKCNPEAFKGRNEVDLKDKWRNLTR